MLEFFVSVLIDFFFPQSYFALFVVFDDFEYVLVEFVDVFVLLSFSDALAQRIYFLEGFWDSVFESATPGEGACDRRVVVVDGRFLIIAIDELLAFEEDGLDWLEVLFEHI